jgi:hypothetical protein
MAVCSGHADRHGLFALGFDRYGDGLGNLTAAGRVRGGHFFGECPSSAEIVVNACLSQILERTSCRGRRRFRVRNRDRWPCRADPCLDRILAGGNSRRNPRTTATAQDRPGVTQYHQHRDSSSECVARLRSRGKEALRHRGVTHKGPPVTNDVRLEGSTLRMIYRPNVSRPQVLSPTSSAARACFRSRESVPLQTQGACVTVLPRLRLPVCFQRVWRVPHHPEQKNTGMVGPIV